MLRMRYGVTTFAYRSIRRGLSVLILRLMRDVVRHDSRPELREPVTSVGETFEGEKGNCNILIGDKIAAQAVMRSEWTSGCIPMVGLWKIDIPQDNWSVIWSIGSQGHTLTAWLRHPHTHPHTLTHTKANMDGNGPANIQTQVFTGKPFMICKNTQCLFSI